MITNFHSHVSAKIVQTGEGSEAEIDIRELHQKPGQPILPAAGRSLNQRPETAVFETGRAKGHAKPGEGHNFPRATGNTPQSRPVIYPIKTKTQSKHLPRRYREHQSKGCRDKIPYRTHAEAYEVIRGMVRNKSKKRAFRSLRSYECKLCGGWHIHSS